MPKKERLPSPGEAGTKLLNNSSPSAPKYSISVLAPRFPFFWPGPLPSGWSTSVKTAPKPVTVAGYDCPIGAGHEEQSFGDVAAYRGEQARGAEGAEDGAVGRIVEEPARPLGPARGGACERPVPGVVNWPPRVFRNTLNGVTGVVVPRWRCPPPSQLISRRPLLSSGRWVIAVVGLSCPEQRGTHRLCTESSRRLARLPGIRSAQQSPWVCCPARCAVCRTWHEHREQAKREYES